MTHDDFLDAGTAERLLAGAVNPADAPPGYGPVAAVLTAASAPGSVPDIDFGELAGVARRAADRSGSSTSRRSPMLGKLLTMKAAAAAGVILLGASGAAAATGALPGAVQGIAHDTLSHVGVDVPNQDNGDHVNDPAHVENGTENPPADSPTSVPADGTTGPGNEPVGTDGTNHDGTTDTTEAHHSEPATSGDSHSGDSHSGDSQSGDGHSGDSTPTTVPTTPTTEPHHDGSGSGSSGTSGSGDAPKN